MHGQLQTLWGALAPIVVLAALTSSQAGEDAVFEMRKVSVFDLVEKAEGDQLQRIRVLQGQHASCSTQPNEQVKAYPKLKSKQPLYGTLTIYQSLVDPTDRAEFHFVIDESGEAKAATPQADEQESAEKPASLLQGLADALLGKTRESRAEAAYDRLYFDSGGDLDLTNDPVVTLMKDPPAAAFMPGEEKQGVCIFDYVNLPFDYGPGLGTRPFRLLPKLRVSTGLRRADLSGSSTSYSINYSSMQFVPVDARQGTIRIGTREYQALLAQSTMVSGRFDSPYTNLFLTPVGGETKPPSGFAAAYFGQWLCSMREVDGQLYDVSTTPLGDKVTVAPYRGDWGSFQVGAGPRDVEKLGAAGVLISKDFRLVTIGDLTSPVPGKKEREKQLPVGDYVPMMLSVDFGELVVRISPNRYSAEAPHDPLEQAPDYPFKIRKDKPFVLDFLGKPEVWFITPQNGQKLKPGETVRLSALLTDPAGGLLIAGLEDTTRKEGELTTIDAQGQRVTMPRYASLDPTVVITDPSGKEVASGKMPFG